MEENLLHQVFEITSIFSSLATFATFALAFVIHYKVEIVRHETNSLKDELVFEVREASLAKGRLEGMLEEKEKENVRSLDQTSTK